jgi:hypothetical protein
MKWSWAGLHWRTVNRGIHRQHSPHRLQVPVADSDVDDFISGASSSLPDNFAAGED